MSLKGQGRITGRSVTKEIPQPAGGVQLETFVPWALVKRGAKKRVIGPSGAPKGFEVEVVAARRAEEEEDAQDTASVRALGLAHYWQHLLDTGRFGSLTEIGAAEGLDLAQVSRIARLAWVGCGNSGRLTRMATVKRYDPPPQ